MLKDRAWHEAGGRGGWESKGKVGGKKGHGRGKKKRQRLPRLESWRLERLFSVCWAEGGGGGVSDICLSFIYLKISVPTPCRKLLPASRDKKSLCNGHGYGGSSCTALASHSRESTDM